MTTRSSPVWEIVRARAVRVLLLLCGVLAPCAGSAEPESWDPAHTWVFAVGVLRFDDPGLATWPDAGRVDARMIAAYRTRGVPADHIVFLKNQEATRANITAKFVQTLRAAAPGDLFVFYYAGHGDHDVHDDKRPIALVTYDTASEWPLADVLTAIDENFRGTRVLLTADCCYSGGLAAEARRHAGGRISYGVLTSAQATSTSTGEWTFTQVLVDLLDGRPLLDLDHDGRITLREAGEYANDEMAFCEGQLATFAASGSFPADLVMASARGGPLPARVGTRCQGREDGKWYKVEILKTDGERSFVRWIGYAESNDSWLEKDDLRPYTPPVMAPGTPVQIKWEKKWYPGHVLRSQLGLQLVHYDDYEDIDDEWVSVERLKSK